MNNRLFALLLLASPVFSYCQKKSVTAKAVPQPYFNYKMEGSALMSKTYWSLCFNGNDGKYKAKSTNEVLKAIDTIKLNPKEPLIERYKPIAKEIYSGLTLFGDELAKFLYESEPIYSVCKFELDSGQVLFIDGCASSNIFNTLRLSSKQRAQKILSSKILPSLKNIKSALNFSGINYIALSFTYASKDFSNSDNILNLKEEYLCGVFPFDILKKYLSNVITVDELIEKSHFYLSDRDTYSPSKIKLAIE